MAKLFDKDLTKGVVGNFLFWLLCYGGAGMTSYYTAHSAYISGIPLYKTIPLGAGVFLALALVANLFSLVVIRHREHTLKAKSPLRDTAADERIKDLTSDLSEKEQRLREQGDRIKELERDKNTADVFLRQYMTSNERLTREEAILRVELAKLKELTDKVIPEKDRTIQEQSARIAELEDKIERGGVSDKGGIGRLVCAVYEDETYDPLRGVTVNVRAVQGGHEYFGQTDKEGVVGLSLPYGHYIVKFNMDGYHARVEGCLIAQADDTHFQVELQKFAV
jgi:hypothetical protein